MLLPSALYPEVVKSRCQTTCLGIPALSLQTETPPPQTRLQKG